MLTCHTAFARQLNDWKLLPRQETFTELYFTDHNSLPTVATPDVPQPVAFTVHSLESQTTTYQYDLVAISTDTGKRSRIGGGTLRVGRGQYKTVDKTVLVPAIGEHIMIQIALAYVGRNANDEVLSSQKQSIDYFVQMSGKPAGEEPL